MIQVYVQTLSSLGTFLGDWIDVESFDTGLAHLLENANIQIREQGIFEEIEEWEIVDYECDYDINLRHYYRDIERLKEISELLNELDNNEIDILNFLLDMGYGIEQVDKDRLNEVRVYDSWHEAVDEFIEYYLEVPEDSNIHSYLNYEKIQRDLEIEGYSEVNNKVFYDL